MFSEDGKIQQKIQHNHTHRKSAQQLQISININFINGVFGTNYPLPFPQPIIIYLDDGINTPDFYNLILQFDKGKSYTYTAPTFKYQQTDLAEVEARLAEAGAKATETEAKMKAIYKLLLQGNSPVEIAAKLKLSIKEVESILS